jgi:hypothetical protein
MAGERILPYISVVDMSSVCRQPLKCDALTFTTRDLHFSFAVRETLFNGSFEDLYDVHQ